MSITQPIKKQAKPEKNFIDPKEFKISGKLLDRKAPITKTENVSFLISEQSVTLKKKKSLVGNITIYIYRI